MIQRIALHFWKSLDQHFLLTSAMPSGHMLQAIGCNLLERNCFKQFSQVLVRGKGCEPLCQVELRSGGSCTECCTLYMFGNSVVKVFLRLRTPASPGGPDNALRLILPLRSEPQRQQMIKQNRCASWGEPKPQPFHFLSKRNASLLRRKEI